jgi:hypothetical protein
MFARRKPIVNGCPILGMTSPFRIQMPFALMDKSVHSVRHLDKGQNNLNFNMESRGSTQRQTKHKFHSTWRLSKILVVHIIKSRKGVYDHRSHGRRTWRICVSWCRDSWWTYHIPFKMWFLFFSHMGNADAVIHIQNVTCVYDRSSNTHANLTCVLFRNRSSNPAAKSALEKNFKRRSPSRDTVYWFEHKSEGRNEARISTGGQAKWDFFWVLLWYICIQLIPRRGALPDLPLCDSSQSSAEDW